jgi:hypothetical protein
VPKNVSCPALADFLQLCPVIVRIRTAFAGRKSTMENGFMLYLKKVRVVLYAPTIKTPAQRLAFCF